jgi:hypothetical protein
MSHRWGAPIPANSIRLSSSIFWGANTCPICKDLGSAAAPSDLQKVALTIDFWQLLLSKKTCNFCSLLFRGVESMLDLDYKASDVIGLQLLISFGEPITASILKRENRSSIFEKSFELYAPLGINSDLFQFLLRVDACLFSLKLKL